MAREPSRKRSHAVIDQVEGSCGERAGRSKPRAPMETLGDALVTTWAVTDIPDTCFQQFSAARLPVRPLPTT
jgi:hypothetical protein